MVVEGGGAAEVGIYRGADGGCSVWDDVFDLRLDNCLLCFGGAPGGNGGTGSFVSYQESACA